MSIKFATDPPYKCDQEDCYFHAKEGPRQCKARVVIKDRGNNCYTYRRFDQRDLADQG